MNSILSFLTRKPIAQLLITASIALFLTLQLAACNPKTLTTAPRSQVVVTQLGNPKSFNPALVNELPIVYAYTHEGLLGENNLTQELEGALAEKWELDPQNKQKITFTLRDGLKWSDGHVLNADDVVFSLNDVYFNPDIPSDAQDVFRIGKDKKFPSVTKIDDRRIEIISPEPFAPLLRQMGGAPILPKHILEASVKTKKGDKPAFLSMWGSGTPMKDIVCSGMYQFDTYVPNQRLTFKKNPYYWRKDAQGNSQPYIDRIVWKSVDNQDTSLLQFRSGGPDINEPIRPEDFALLKGEEETGEW